MITFRVKYVEEKDLSRHVILHLFASKVYRWCQSYARASEKYADTNIHLIFVFKNDLKAFCIC